MKLGAFIAALERADPAMLVRFDILGFTPTKFRSYRGYYDQLALGWTADDNKRMLADQLLDQARAAIGATFEGHKGGEYVMDEDTPLWMANVGYSGDRARRIIGIFRGEYDVQIRTDEGD